MPKKNERVIPVTVSDESTADLQKLIDRTGMLQSEILRNAVTAALRTLAERDSLTLPIEFVISNNGKKK